VITPGEERDIEGVIPSRKNRLQPRTHEKELYKARHLIENFLAKLKPFRGIATRDDNRLSNVLGGIYLVASLIWLA
jgi:transposase